MTGQSQQNQEHPRSTSTPETNPFLAVSSFTNPHDIATYSTLPPALAPAFVRGLVPPVPVGPGGSVPVPAQGEMSQKPTQGTFQVPLNQTGFPQNCAKSSPTQNENLLHSNKPQAQYDYSMKNGLGLAAKAGLAIASAADSNSNQDFMKHAVEATLGVTVPFQTQRDSNGAALGFLQYYGHMMYMVGRHILRVLEALEESGLRKETIVVFISDHGEYGAAHSMMMEKWHTGYQEMMHVPMLVSSPLINLNQFACVAIDGLTSHIDLLPTILGLAHVSEKQRNGIFTQLSKTHQVAALPGLDLSSNIRKAGHESYECDDAELHNLKERSVLFATDDMITEPLPKDDDPHNINSWESCDVYASTVEYLCTQTKILHLQFPHLSPGPVLQPAHVRALRSGDWKLVQYCDPWSEKPVPEQWEMHNLKVDPNETTNLLIYKDKFPNAIPEKELPDGLNMSRQELEDIAIVLRAELVKLESELLPPTPAHIQPQVH